MLLLNFLNLLFTLLSASKITVAFIFKSNFNIGTRSNPTRESSLITNLFEESIPLTKEPPLKILLLVEPTPFNYISGYSNRFKETLKFLKKAGDEVHILTPDDSENPQEEFLGFPITSVHGFRFPWYNTVNLSFDLRGKTAEIIEKFKPDIIHVTSPGFLLFPALLFSRIYGLPIVMSYHTHLPVYVKSYISLPGRVAMAEQLLNMVHNRADLTLTTSPQLKSEVEAFGMKQIDVWQKGIDVERFSPQYRNDTIRNILTQGHPESNLLIYVGRLGVEKKLKNLRKVLDANPNARLAFVGKGPYEEELKAYFKNYNVFFAGQKTGDELSQAYASADLFLMPSDSETLGFVVLEAMASGVPVVGVAAGGLLDLVESGKTGYLSAPNDDMEEFTIYVSKLLEDTKRRKEMGVAARKWAEGWSWESATSKLRNIQYRKAINNYKQRTSEEVVSEELQARYQSYRPDLC